MLFHTGLARRHRQDEIMDQPDLDENRHRQALRGLERINFWSGSAGILWRPIRALAQEASDRPLRILDVATGAGDVPVGLWRRARREGLSVEIEGWDMSPCAVAHARQRVLEHRADVRFTQMDVLKCDFPREFDVIVSSLFLHHLSEEQAVSLLRRMRESASRMILINDLVRSPSGLVLSYVVTRLLTTCDVVHVDGPRSVEGAFTVSELHALARQASLDEASVERRWPCRMLLTWRRR